jgi:hypothetical protein
MNAKQKPAEDLRGLAEMSKYAAGTPSAPRRKRAFQAVATEHAVISLIDERDAALAREAALQQRLNEADQRIDELATANEILAEGLRALATLRSAASLAHVRTLSKQALNKCHGFLSQLTKDSPGVGS